MIYFVIYLHRILERKRPETETLKWNTVTNHSVRCSAVDQSNKARLSCRYWYIGTLFVTDRFGFQRIGF